MADSLPVKPIVLVSILPFGTTTVTDDKTNKSRNYFRFSLCIDLKCNYSPEDNEETSALPAPYPDLAALVSFIREFAIGQDNIHDKILQSLTNIPCISLGGATAKAARISFPEFLNPGIFWNKLFTEPLQKIAGTPNTLSSNMAALPVRSFFEKGLPEAESLYQMLIAQTQNIQEDFLSKIQESNEVIAELKGHLELSKQNMQGIHNFAVANNDKEWKASINFKSKSLDESADNILECFSVIHSNLVLQRLFGLVIDFEIDAAEFVIPGKVLVAAVPSALQEIRGDVRWVCMQTLMNVIDGTLIAVEPKDLTRPSTIAKNHDVVAKLQSIATMEAKIEKIKDTIKAAELSGDERLRYQMINEYINIDSAALTRGMNIYINNLGDMLADFEKPENQTKYIEPLRVHDIMRGWRFGLLKTDDRIEPIGIRKLSVHAPVTVPKEFLEQDFAAGSFSGMHSLEEGDTVKHNLISDHCILNWSGENIGMPSVFVSPEDDTNMPATTDQGSVSISAELIQQKFSEIFVENHLPKTSGLTDATGDANVTGTRKLIEIDYEHFTNQKLIFGRTYNVVLIPEYKNGWAIPYNFVEKNLDCPFVEWVRKFVFKRNEAVKPVELFLAKPLYKKVPPLTADDIVKQTALPGKEGESLHNLVIRNRSNGNDEAIKETTEKSVRYILPPAISFQHAMWHNKIFEIHEDAGPSESHRWYMKHHFPVVEGARKKDENGDFITSKNSVGEMKDETYSLKEALEGSTRMPSFFEEKWYLPESWERENFINYLPDPLSAGFRLEFFLDPDRRIKAPDYKKYEEYEYYFDGKYPYIRAWKVIAEDAEQGEPVVAENETICIRVQKGVELFLTIRTILHPNYEREFETFGNYNSFTQYGNNSLLTPPLHVSLVHALQRPIIRPELLSVQKCDKALNATQLRLMVNIRLEQLSLYRKNDDIVDFIHNAMPTGKVELYAKWEEYKDDPDHIVYDEWTPHLPVNKVDLSRIESAEGETPAVFEAEINIADQIPEMIASLSRTGNNSLDSANYSLNVTAMYDVRETKYLEKWLWIKNKSKFASYYSKNTSDKDDLDENKSSLESFNRNSAKPFCVKILNNRKPNPPVLSSKSIVLLSVVETIQKKNTITHISSLRRLRFYFERGRLSSGKDERLGFIVNEINSNYNDYFVKAGLVSQVGADITTDSSLPYDGLYRNEQVLLNKSHFVINDPYDLADAKNEKKANDLEHFQPRYVEEVGLMTYLPAFDKSANSWYLDIELDINDNQGAELHTAFLQFGIVNYQENSINYNSGGGANLVVDCRISDVSLSGFVYLMGKRTVYLEKIRQGVKCTIHAEAPSICTTKDGPKTRFFAAIEISPNGNALWATARNQGKEILEELAVGVPREIEYAKSIQAIARLLVLETECFSEALGVVPVSLRDVYDNKYFRVVSVHTINI